MNSTSSATIAIVLASLVACQSHLHAESPFDGSVEAKTQEFDPFAANPLVDRFQWREYLSINCSLVSGADVVSVFSASTITLSSGNEIVIDDATVFVRQSPGEPSSSAARNDIANGTPITYEIDINRSAAAQRIVVWQGFGPFRHKIYDDRINTMIKSLAGQVEIGKREIVKLEHPGEPMQIEFGSSKKNHSTR